MASQFAKYDTREAWLKAAESIMSFWIETEGYSYPTNTRVACGWPKSMKGRGEHIGQCWSTIVSGDEHFEIFISPSLDNPVDVCGVLIHEMTHATVGIEEGHNKVFGKLARQLGMEGKLTATTVGEELESLIRTKVLSTLGDYPHAKMTVNGGELKKPKTGKTYLIKCSCDDCGYIAYTTAKWIDEVGLPHCPDHGALTDGRD